MAFYKVNIIPPPLKGMAALLTENLFIKIAEANSHLIYSFLNEDSSYGIGVDKNEFKLRYEHLFPLIILFTMIQSFFRKHSSSILNHSVSLAYDRTSCKPFIQITFGTLNERTFNSSDRKYFNRRLKKYVPVTYLTKDILFDALKSFYQNVFPERSDCIKFFRKEMDYVSHQYSNCTDEIELNSLGRMFNKTFFSWQHLIAFEKFSHPDKRECTMHEIQTATINGFFKIRFNEAFDFIMSSSHCQYFKMNKSEEEYAKKKFSEWMKENSPESEEDLLFRCRKFTYFSSYNNHMLEMFQDNLFEKTFKKEIEELQAKISSPSKKNDEEDTFELYDEVDFPHLGGAKCGDDVPSFHSEARFDVLTSDIDEELEHAFQALNTSPSYP